MGDAKYALKTEIAGAVDLTPYAKIVDVPAINHNHDISYYTKSQSDAKYALFYRPVIVENKNSSSNSSAYWGKFIFWDARYPDVEATCQINCLPTYTYSTGTPTELALYTSEDEIAPREMEIYNNSPTFAILIEPPPATTGTTITFISRFSNRRISAGGTIILKLIKRTLVTVGDLYTQDIVYLMIGSLEP